MIEIRSISCRKRILCSAGDPDAKVLDRESARSPCLADPTWGCLVRPEHFADTQFVFQKSALYQNDGALELTCRQAPAVMVPVCVMHLALGDVVTVAAAILRGVGRAEPVADLVDDQPRQKRRRSRICPATPLDRIAGKPFLHFSQVS